MGRQLTRVQPSPVLRWSRSPEDIAKREKELVEAMAKMTPSERLRVALAGRYGR